VLAIHNEFSVTYRKNDIVQGGCQQESRLSSRKEPQRDRKTALCKIVTEGLNMKEKVSSDLKEFVKKPKTILWFVIVVLILIIFFQNTQVVSFRIFFWKISMSQIILIPLAMIIGLVLGYVIGKLTGNRHKGRIVD
jgi:uncharacterized integral membrane protein